MQNTLAVVGSQWGDEGKGKITDFFAQHSDYVVRWSGGNNAGHTIVFNDKEYKLNSIPSGIFNKNCINIIANGCVLNLKKLTEEMEYLKGNGFDCENLRISNRVHLIFPYHLEVDNQQEINRKNSIGTTKKGIGPTYQDKTSRDGIRICDLFDEKKFKEKLINNLKFWNDVLKNIYKGKVINVEDIYKEYKIYFDKIKHLITDTSLLLNNAILDNKKVLFEGAQGVMLDLDHGTYPFVTSSNPSATSIPICTGIASRYIQNVIGVTKAYSTRVGEGSFPSEISDKIATYIREKAHEYGVTTGRPRRIGWIDIVLLKHSIRVSGINFLAITLLDILTDIDEIKICVGYKLNGKEIDYIPASIDEYAKCKPIFITLPGWKEKINNNPTKIKKLPKNAKKYLKKIEDLLNIPVNIVSYGADRIQTIIVKKIF